MENKESRSNTIEKRELLKQMINEHFLWTINKDERTRQEYSEYKTQLIQLALDYYGLDKPASEKEAASLGFPLKENCNHTNNDYFDRLTFMETIESAVRNYDSNNDSGAKFFTYFNSIYTKVNMRYLANFNANMKKGISLRSEYYNAMKKIAEFAEKEGLDFNELRDETLTEFTNKFNQTGSAKRYEVKDVKKLVKLSAMMQDRANIFEKDEDGIESEREIIDIKAGNEFIEKQTIIDALLLLAVNLEDKFQEVFFSSGIVKMIREENGLPLIEPAEAELLKFMTKSYLDFILELLSCVFAEIERSDYKPGRANADKDIADFMGVTKGYASKKGKQFRMKKELVQKELFE